MNAMRQSLVQQLLPSRFSWLMGLHGENYHRLCHLFRAHLLQPGRYCSSVDDGLDVVLEVQQRHRYTLDMVISYACADHLTGQPAPSAQLRLYLDAHVAEVQHCHPGKHLWQVLGPWPELTVVARHRLRMASFLNRWLVYLAEQGHSAGTLGPAT